MGIKSSKKEWADYIRAYRQSRHKRRKRMAIKMLGGRCKKCGSKKRMQFDHVIASSKVSEKDAISYLSYHATEEYFLEELKKCQLLCFKCHQFKSVTDLGKKHAKGAHGTISSYRYCHCDLCKHAKHVYYAAYTKKKKEARPLNIGGDVQTL